MSENLVAIFVPSMRGGGAEHAMLNLAIGLQERGLSVDMLLIRVKGPYLSKIPPQIRVIDLGALRVLTSLRGLVRYLKKEQPASLISAIDHANIVAILANYLARVNTKIIITVQNTALTILSKKRKLKIISILLLMKIFYSWAYAVVAVSRAVADDMTNLGVIDRSRIKVIHNPVITPEIKSKSKSNIEHRWLVTRDRPVLVSVGRLTAQKDFWTLFKALKLILQQRPIRLIILGEGEERESLEKLSVELGIEADVDMPGFVDNPYAYMAKADVFILSSAWEGLPTVLIEALALGTPVVAADCPGGSREILQAGRLGRLVPVGDQKMLAEAIVATLDEPVRPVDPEALKPFTQEAVVEKYLELLKR
ncbi:MAG: glycosyltransferase [Candidatus Omnitrophica bacterium]|nr:glycosyltransferase [Candidatus Omnitrophota bacterium]MBU2251255.1 glycosyltransferase [Candidatus Omnitrophota bacterium]